MPNTTTRTLQDEYDRLDARLDDLADQLADADAGAQTTQWLRSEAQEVNEALKAVATHIDRHGADAEVEVQPLNGRLYGEVQDKVATLAAAKPGDGGVPGTSRNVYAAAGLVDAPFLDGDADTLEARTDAVGEATPAPGVAMWLENLINDVGRLDEGNWQSLEQRLVDRLR